MSPTETASSQSLTLQRRSLQLATSCARAVHDGRLQALAMSALMRARSVPPQTGCGLSSPAPGNALHAAYRLTLVEAMGRGAAQPSTANTRVSHLFPKTRRHTDGSRERSAPARKSELPPGSRGEPGGNNGSRHHLADRLPPVSERRIPPRPLPPNESSMGVFAIPTETLCEVPLPSMHLAVLAKHIGDLTHAW
jgi:hypothetical protein